MKHKRKKIVALALVFALAIGMVTPVLAANNDDSTASENAAVYEGDFDVYEDEDMEYYGNNFDCSCDPSFSTAYNARLYSNYYADNCNDGYIHVKCYQEENSDCTSTLKIINPNATTAQIEKYANEQFEKGTMKKLMVALLAQDDEGNVGVVVDNSGKIADQYYPEAQMSSIASALGDLVNYVPDGEYNFAELCQMCDVILFPYGYTSSQQILAVHYGTELITMGYYYSINKINPRYYIYSEPPSDPHNFANHTIFDIYAPYTTAEAFALLYGNPSYKWYLFGTGYDVQDGNGNPARVRSSMCQLDTMETDGTVVLESKVCYGHNFELMNTTVDSDSNTGTMSIMCTNCGYTTTFNTSNITVKSSTQATCENSGLCTYSVKGTYNWNIINGETDSQSFSDEVTVTTSKTGHTEVTDPAVSSTCTETGLTEGSHCSVCGAVLVAQTEVPATGHVWDNGKVTSSPTCTAEGVITYTCKNCNATETVAISENGHTEVTDPAVAPTCDTNGLTEGSHCSVCGAIIKEQEVIYATGHDYTDPQYKWQNSGAVVVSNVDSVRSDLASLAEKQIGVPYVYAGKSPSEGFDCSGLTYYLYKTVTGIELPWNVDDLNKDTGIRYGQNLCGDEITKGSDYNEFVSRLKVGDLIFMNEDKDDGTPTHVGIFVGTDDNGVSWMIEASKDDGAMVLQKNMFFRWDAITGARRIIVGINDFTTGAVMTLSCKKCGHTESIDCDVELVSTVEPTCTDEGMMYYTAVGEYNGKTYTSSFDEPINPKGHSFRATDSSIDEIVSLGVDTGPTGVITLMCEDCGDTETIRNCDVEMKSEKDPTCGTDGYITYSVSGEYNGKDYTSECTIEILATGDHEWNYSNAELEYHFDEGYANITVPCDNCDEVMFFGQVPIQYDYTYGTWNEEEQRYEFESLRGSVSIQGTDGNTYYWEEDAETSASIDSQHNWILAENIGNDPTCTANGYRMYVCSDDDCDAVKTITSSALGHNWNMNEESANKTAEWSDDYSVCTLTFTCLRCNDTDTADSTSVSQVTNNDGTITYTATVPFNDVTFHPSVTVSSESQPPEDDPEDDSDDDKDDTEDNGTMIMLGSGTVGDNTNNNAKAQIDNETVAAEGNAGTNGTNTANATAGNAGTGADVTTNTGVGSTNTGTYTTMSANTGNGSDATETGSVKTGDVIEYSVMCLVAVGMFGAIGYVTYTHKNTRREKIRNK